MPAYISGININARMTDGSISEHIGNSLGIDINPTNFELNGEKFYFGGESNYSITDENTTYVFLGSDGYLDTDLSSYPVTSHIRLGRVISSSGRISNILDDRIFLFGGSPSGVTPHASSHSEGGSDPILVENLGTTGFKGNVPMSDGSGNLVMTLPLGSRTLLVGSEFQYSTIKDALSAAALMSPSALSPIVIYLTPGLYIEDNSSGPLELIDYVHINGTGAQNSAVIVPAVNSNFLFRSSVDGYGSINAVVCANCSGPTGGAILVDRGANNAFLSVAFVGCAVGARVTGFGSQAVFGTVQSSSCYNLFVADTYGALIVSKVLVVDVFGTCYTANGGFIESEGFTIFARRGVGSIGCYVDNSGQLELHDGKMSGTGIGVECHNNASVRLELVRIESIDSYNIYIADSDCSVKVGAAEFASADFYNPNNGTFIGNYRDPTDNIFKIAGSLDMISGSGTWKGFPRMTGAEQSSMVASWSTNQQGRGWFNTTLGRFAYWDGRAVIYIKPTQVVTVGEEGADYSSIKAALESITDASPTKPYTILVNAGIYIEDQILLKPYIALQALGKGSCIISPTNHNIPLVVMDSFTEIVDFSFFGPTNSSSIFINDVSSTAVTNCQFQLCQTAINSTGSNVYSYINSCRILNGVTNAFVIENKSKLLIKTSLIYATNGCIVNDGYATLSGTDFRNCIIAFYANNSGEIKIETVDLEGCHYGLKTGPDGYNFIYGNAVCFDGYSIYNIYQEQSGSIISLESSYLTNESFFVSNWEEVFLSYDVRDNDVKSIFGKDVNIGLPQKGRQVYFGKGSPYHKSVIVLSTDNTTSNILDGGNFIDLSLENIATSEFSFQGNLDGYSILIGSNLEDGYDNLKHWGLNISQVIAATEITKRSFSFEIWNGSSWEEINVFSINSNNEYKYGNEVFIRENCIEKILYGIKTDTLWEKKTINGDTLFWSRIVIKDTLSVVPTFDNIELISSSANINDSGLFLLLGKSKYIQKINNLNFYFGNSGGVVSSNINIGSGSVPLGWSHNIKETTFGGNGDSLYCQFTIPNGIDTSMPFDIKLNYSVSVAGTSSATIIASVLPIEVVGVLEADPNGNTVPIERTLSETEEFNSLQAQVKTNNTMSVLTTNKMQSVVFTDFDISNYYEGDVVAIRIELDDKGGTSTEITIWGIEVVCTMCSFGKNN